MKFILKTIVAAAVISSNAYGMDLVLDQNDAAAEVKSPIQVLEAGVYEYRNALKDPLRHILSFLTPKDAQGFDGAFKKTHESFSEAFAYFNINQPFKEWLGEFKIAMNGAHHPFNDNMSSKLFLKFHGVDQVMQIIQSVQNGFKNGGTSVYEHGKLIQKGLLCLEEGDLCKIAMQLEKTPKDLDLLMRAARGNRALFMRLKAVLKAEPLSFVTLREKLAAYIGLFDGLEVLQAVSQRFGFVTVLPQNTQDEKDLKAFGFMMIVQDTNVSISTRDEAAKSLLSLGEEYKPQAAQGYLSIAQDSTVDVYVRIKAAKSLLSLGEEYKPQAAQVYLSIAQDSTVDGHLRIKAAQSLLSLGEVDKPQAISVLQAMEQTPYVIQALARLQAN